MAKKRLVLTEDDSIIVNDFAVDAIKDEINPMDVIPPEELEPVMAEEPKEEVVVNAYSDMVQDLLRKQWEVINSADSIIATINSEEHSDINKEEILAVLNKLVEDTTVSVGMTTKALGIIDPSQEELMDQGVEKAEEVVAEVVPEQEEEIVEECKSCTEDLKDIHVNFKDLPYYERNALEEIYYALESYWTYLENDDEDSEILPVLNAMNTEQIESMCKSINSQYIDYNSYFDAERFYDDVSSSVEDYIEDFMSKNTAEINTAKEGE